MGALLLLVAGTALAASPPLPGASVDLGAELVVEGIVEGAYRVVHRRPFAANSLLVEMPDGTLVLCDTPYDDEATGQLLAWMSETFGPRRVVAVNSHFHADALGGNQALRRAGAVSYGSELTARMLEERGARVKQQLLDHLDDDPALRERYRRARWVPPEKRFPAAEGMRLEFGGEPVVLYYPGPGHSPDNIVTWFPRRGILFGGCLVRAGRTIPNVADADLDAWPRAVENLRGFEARIIVPGHGAVGGPELLDNTLRAIETYRSEHVETGEER